MTSRTQSGTTYTQNFNVENEVASVVVGGQTTTFTYDTAGQRVKTVQPNGVITDYPFPGYEVENPTGSATVRITFTIAGQAVALRVGSAIYHLYNDHLGSTAVIGTSGARVVSGSRAYYYPFGSYRGTAPTQTLTDRQFTGQQENLEVGLYYYNARFYVPSIGRFASADTIVPNPANPQSFNRYTYALNNPLKYTDPTGHMEDCSYSACGSTSPAPPSPVTPAVPATPWQLSDLSGDGQIDREDMVLAAQLYGQLEDILLDAMIMPADSNFNPFGGRMTSTNCDKPGRPPCDARHPAVDSNTGLANEGDPIYAIAYGRVVRTGATMPAFDGTGAAGGFGFYVLIEHDVYGTKLYSVYAHNGEGTILVEQGDIISGGTQIASMGNSGTAIVHLHFEIRQATNVDLDADNPFQTQTYWPATVTELNANYVDIGPVFGYSTSYASWAQTHP